MVRQNLHSQRDKLAADGVIERIVPVYNAENMRSQTNGLSNGMSKANSTASGGNAANTIGATLTPSSTLLMNASRDLIVTRCGEIEGGGISSGRTLSRNALSLLVP